eukprot:TRINITY_DN2002_c0_g3_i1.p1 TRINITY_DN2002_c0_g3~~TRINITY_DN2002_c0_g3_i1.p1  ORF type:complete len:475 (-),score=182.88 TRINITY_DN2002_c0_g3_i1:146-1570(-)
MVSANVVAAVLGAASLSAGADAATMLRAHHVVKTKEAPIDPMKVQLPKVPQLSPKLVGHDGLPELPTVDQMMDSASSVLSAMNSKAAELQKEMQAVQSKNQARLRKQKTIYDNKLKAQEQDNQHVVSDNSKLAKKLMEVKKSNEKLLKKAKQLEKDNDVRRSELKELSALMGKTDSFTEDILTATDDSKAPELAVLRDNGKAAKAEVTELAKHKDKTDKKTDEKKDAIKKTEEKGEEKSEDETEEKSETSQKSDEKSKEKSEEKSEDDSEDAEDDESDEAEKSEKSTKKEKEVSKKSKEVKKADKKVEEDKKAKDSDSKEDDYADDEEGDDDYDDDSSDKDKAPSFIEESAEPGAEGILTVLTSGLKDLKAQGKSSEDQLKSLFLGSYRTGEQRHTALVAQKKVLQQTYETMTSYESRLKVADAHLEKTKAKLDNALHKTGLILQKLSKLALGPSEKAAVALENMRKATLAKKK